MSLTREQNELLCRIENGAPMGQMLRNNFWFPVALSQKLVADGAPLKVRLLGEDFVAFRSTDGRLGFFDEKCPHRGASLLLARNEDNALRCIYHGWKYSVTGEVVEVPTEPVNAAAFCKKVPLNHYSVREAAGVVWVWIGKGQPKPFPEFEFNSLPDDQVYVSKQLVNCNWVQDVEGGMDSAHVGILHQAWIQQARLGATTDDMAPVYDFDETAGGYRYAAIRNAAGGKKHLRINEYVLPWYSFICPDENNEGDRLTIMSTPIDDENTFHWLVRYNPHRPLSPSLQNPAENPDDFPPGTGGAANRWGQDRGMMMRGHFSGFGHLNTEDFAACESQGAIADRSKEFLNSGDLAVVRLRRLLLDLVREHQATEGNSSGFPHDSMDYHRVRAHVDTVKDESVWKSIR
ncbi:Rieske 2Fe-2S domain-containing protein [Paraburkholderia sartisoli]|uniref:Phenylpropionate dioxygenase, large terminal subunit n=1 Tax=Paraburkholderia sartisoli TaxID=83784 RepID=A0A1H4GRI7_9BURK|nr:Rieske 2Fe-2S domain-containing protein [Paraburkholderia sartisoli]SEB12205.1 Phenylpropionate dioxygenase, large terminal subunit [Paraburkholderia sartisoli]